MSKGWIDAGELARIAASTQAWAEALDVAEHLAWREAIGWR